MHVILADRYQDISLSQVSSRATLLLIGSADVMLPSQWLALTPPELVKAHLGVSDDTIAHMSKTKGVVV